MTREWDQGLKRDAGKAAVHLVPREAIESIAHVLTYGVKKYGRRDGWREVEPVRYYDAAIRHLLAYNEAKRTGACGNDEESGLPHIWHALTNAAFLVTLEGEEGNAEK